MRGLLNRGIAQASGAAGKAREVALSKSSAAPSRQGAGGDSVLDKALRSITHTSSAAVPREALAEVVRLATENEESLAQVLRHMEDNVTAPLKEWRRIHGALQLLDLLLKPSTGEALIGNIWFECKIQGRLEDLKTFSYADDRRVTSLVQRAAANVERAFNSQSSRNADDDFSCSTRLGSFKAQTSKFAEDDLSNSTMLGSCSERAQGGSSVSSDPDVIDDRFTSHAVPQIIGHPAILEMNTLSFAAFPTRAEMPTKEAPPLDVIDVEVCSDGGDSFMSRLCRCFYPRETREHIFPEEKMGLTVTGASS